MKSYSAIALCSLVLALGCKGTVEVNCTEEPTDPACVELCATEPTLPHCSGNDGGTDAGPGDGGTDADAFVSNCTSECTGETPICDEDEDNAMCVQCLVPADCEGVEGRPMCDMNRCVECASSTQCETAEASLCGDDGLCAECAENADCDGVVDGDGNALNVCDTSGDTNVCVGCTEATAADDCDAFSCNPATQLCTETERGDVPDCGRCVGDAECDFDAGFRCVPMNFQGTDRPDGYCLKLATETCARPYLVFVTDESLSGADETMYCGIDQGATTCDAVRALRSSESCSDGDGGQDVSLCADAGARCEMVGAAPDQCTIPCGVANNCPEGLTCDGAYCGS